MCELAEGRDARQDIGYTAASFKAVETKRLRPGVFSEAGLRRLDRSLRLRQRESFTHLVNLREGRKNSLLQKINSVWYFRPAFSALEGANRHNFFKSNCRVG